uniref:Uncharacterized protein n=1 Tax=Rhizophora mucronata TaxID=61149 RepID=A0A2P2NNM2_RHIMU
MIKHHLLNQTTLTLSHSKPLPILIPSQEKNFFCFISARQFSRI